MPALRSSPGRDRAHDFRQLAKPALVIGDERAPYRRSLIAPDLAKQSRELAVQTIQSALFGTRSEERRGGKAWVSQCRSRGAPSPSKKKQRLAQGKRTKVTKKNENRVI